MEKRIPRPVTRTNVYSDEAVSKNSSLDELLEIAVFEDFAEDFSGDDNGPSTTLTFVLKQEQTIHDIMPGVPVLHVSGNRYLNLETDEEFIIKHDLQPEEE